MCNFNYVFAAADVAFRCEVPACEPLDNRFHPSWSSFALLNHTGSCQRQAPLFNTSHLLEPPLSSAQTCSPEHFALNRTIPCRHIAYEDYNSIVAEFDLGCEPWKRTLIGTVHNLGLIFSYILSGFISDRYGRKVVIVCSPLVVGTVGLVKSFSVSYWMLLVLEFLETALGYGSASMVLSLEAVSQKRRVVFSCMWDILTSLGTAFFGLIAWQVPYWRSMMRVIYAPLLVAVFYIFLVDEGVRWLLAHNKQDEAVRVLNKVAKYNNVTLSTKAKAMLTKISEERSKVDKEGVKVSHSVAGPLMSALQSRRMMVRVLLVAAQLFCCQFVFSGAIINSGTISGNRFINFAALSLVAVPTRVLTALTLTRFGRKAPVCTAYFLCALFFMTSGFVPKSMAWTSLTLYLAGNMASSFGLFAVMVMAMETFPTISRNSLFNLAQLLGRLGAVLAPQAPLLDKYMSGLPSVVFGLVALVPALLSLFMPDTSHSYLPENLADAERLDHAPVEPPTMPSTPAPPFMPKILPDEDNDTQPVKQVARF
ncbi:hypothetical protein O0L34_g5733 [Tuta absoluta]|nr:hypothetical protein O0L34_g5733 [Tuta absoluta]